jgi:DNA-binding NarL/FixJ family response regulator
MIRVVIADDHTIMREGLKRILLGIDDIEVVGEAADGFEVLNLVRHGGFQVLLLDLTMPGRSGVDLIRQIKDESPKLAVLILTMHEEEQYAVRAIRAGALGYLTKESASAKLVSAIHKVAIGRPFISMEVENSSLSMQCQAILNNRIKHYRIESMKYSIYSCQEKLSQKLKSRFIYQQKQLVHIKHGFYKKWAHSLLQN